MSRLGYEEDDQNDGVETEQETRQETNDDENVEVTDSPSVRVVEETQDQRIAAEAGDDTVDEQDDTQQGRRRETAKERRARARAAKERDKQELDLLRSTVAKQADRQSQIERELVVTRITDIDNRLATAANEAATFDNIFAKAITAKNGEDAAEAQRLANDAKSRWHQLKQNRDQLAKVLEQGPAQQEKPYAAQARDWLSKNSWYNPASGDEDSLIAEAIDKALMKQMNPESPDYWTTLTKKVRERLPHRFGRTNQQNDDTQDDEPEDDYVAPARTESRRKGPPTGGSSRTNSGRGGPSEIRLPREMVEAMKEAGHWNDPKQRERVAKRYLESIKNSRSG